ncbi:MAG: hypothetical protein ABIQ44_09370 [Chloroflexia bacterium]
MSYQQPRSTSYLRSQIASNRRPGVGLCFLWFSSGCIFGLIGGVLLVLSIATFGVSKILPFKDNLKPGHADIVVSIDESYLNTVIAQRINGSYETGLDGLTLTDLHIDLAPDNRMDLIAKFRVNVSILSFDVNARVDNRISIGENGTLLLGMIGDPQLGDLNVSLDFLPFDLKSTIRQAVNNVNNNLLIAEINEAARPTINGTRFGMDNVTTTDDALTIRLTKR